MFLGLPPIFIPRAVIFSQAAWHPWWLQDLIEVRPQVVAAQLAHLSIIPGFLQGLALLLLAIYSRISIKKVI